MAIESLKKYIQDEIATRGFDETGDIRIDFADLGTEEETKQAVAELGYVAKPAEGQGVWRVSQIKTTITVPYTGVTREDDLIIAEMLIKEYGGDISARDGRLYYCDSYEADIVEDFDDINIIELNAEEYRSIIDKMCCYSETQYKAVEENELVTKFENIGLDGTGDFYMIDVDLIDGSNATVYIDRHVFEEEAQE